MEPPAAQRRLGLLTRSTRSPLFARSADADGSKSRPARVPGLNALLSIPPLLGLRTAESRPPMSALTVAKPLLPLAGPNEELAAIWFARVRLRFSSDFCSSLMSPSR